mmetsp:Transcript_23402/g.32031  ORF Transcript_23402/g.32031 Transcript_23402/m.32031 type:complete len:80 (+) Transcript_23402:79-318(+)
MNRSLAMDPAHPPAHGRIPGSPLNRAGIYDRTYYYMKSHMHILQQKPHVHFPLWVRDFVDAFEDIDRDDGSDGWMLPSH